MSAREQLVRVAEIIPDEQIAEALLMLYRLLYEQAEAEDDAYCIALNEAFLANPHKGELVSLEEAAKRFGVSLA